MMRYFASPNTLLCCHLNHAKRSSFGLRGGRSSLILSKNKFSEGIIDTILHGVKVGNNEDEKFAQQLRVPKLPADPIYEFMYHTVPIDSQKKYFDNMTIVPSSLVESCNSLLSKARFNKKNKVPSDNHEPLSMKWAASWSTLVGDLYNYLHIIQYSNYEAFSLAKESNFAKWNSLNTNCLKASSEICFAFNFTNAVTLEEFKLLEDLLALSKKKPLESLPIYEMRTYDLQPGKLLEWTTQWRVGMESRAKHSKFVGGWFSRLGTLNRVHHMWRFDSLLAREEERNMAWRGNTWSSSVAYTAGLIKNMQCEILKPSPHIYASL